MSKMVGRQILCAQRQAFAYKTSLHTNQLKRIARLSSFACVSAQEQEVKLEYFESPDEITEFVTVQKYCEANTCNCSPNRRDQTLDPNIFSPTEYDSRGKKVGSRNTIPLRINNLGRQVQVPGCWTCLSRA